MPKIKTQIFYIHGGMTFKNTKDYLYWLKNREISLDKKIRWDEVYLEKSLSNNYQLIKPRMPLSERANYKDWVIHFERYFPHLKNNLILIGASLGGIFLAKYLSENKFPKKIKSVYLVCPPFDDTLIGEDLAGGFILKSNLSLLEKNCSTINLLFSKNDDVVPIEHSTKYAAKLKNANIIIYNHIKGHFKIDKFPEIIQMIKNDQK